MPDILPPRASWSGLNKTALFFRSTIQDGLKDAANPHATKALSLAQTSADRLTETLDFAEQLAGAGAGAAAGTGMGAGFGYLAGRKRKTSDRDAMIGALLGAPLGGLAGAELAQLHQGHSFADGFLKGAKAAHFTEGQAIDLLAAITG